MCPVCRARFRGSVECSRCGADLTTLMELVSKAWRLRQAARQELLDGDTDRAFVLASQAQRICRTPGGAGLERLGYWLTSLPNEGVRST